MHTDLTFFTNEPGSTLLDRFKCTLKDVRYFDILVGYFRSSGFFHLYKSFEHIDKISVIGNERCTVSAINDVQFRQLTMYSFGK